MVCTTTTWARASPEPPIYGSHEPRSRAQRRTLFLLWTAEPVHADEEGADGAAFSVILFFSTIYPGLFFCKHACPFLHVLCPSRSHGGCAAQRPCRACLEVFAGNKTLEQPVEAAAGYDLCSTICDFAASTEIRKHFVSRPYQEPVFSSFLPSRCFLFLFRCFSLHTSLLSRPVHAPLPFASS